MTHDQIKRAAILLESLAKMDKEIVVLANASKVSAYAHDGHSNVLARVERHRKSSDAPWTDDHAATLHHFLMKLHRSAREKVARELRQLNVAVPEVPA